MAASSTTPLPGHRDPQAGRRRGASSVMLERMGSRVRGQRKPYKQRHAWSCHHMPSPATHTPLRVALPSKLSASPHSSAFWGHTLLRRTCYSPWLIPGTSGCPWERNLSQVLHGSALPTLTLGLARCVRGTNAQIIPPSSTTLPALQG